MTRCNIMVIPPIVAWCPLQSPMPPKLTIGQSCSELIVIQLQVAALHILGGILTQQTAVVSQCDPHLFSQMQGKIAGSLVYYSKQQPPTPLGAFTANALTEIPATTPAELLDSWQKGKSSSWHPLTAKQLNSFCHQELTLLECILWLAKVQ